MYKSLIWDAIKYKYRYNGVTTVIHLRSLMPAPINQLFTAHPASVGETYFEHLVCATRFSCRMIGAGIACFLHGLLPFLFVKTGSKTICELHDNMVVNRAKMTAADRTLHNSG